MQVYKSIKYIRLSYTDDKTVESDSVANQRRLIDDFIEKRPEIEVIGEKIDDGYNGVRFIAINDNVDTANDAPDELTVSVKNIMNEAYCRDISIKTRSVLEVKRRSGDFVGAFAMYGYFKTGDKRKSLEVDLYAANVVRDIFRKRLEGFGALHIAEELNRLGILSPLAYKRNHGLAHAKGGYTDREDKPSSEWARVENFHEAIISPEMFDAVQAYRKEVGESILRPLWKKPSPAARRAEKGTGCLLVPLPYQKQG